jgi:hypothetical protein
LPCQTKSIKENEGHYPKLGLSLTSAILGLGIAILGVLILGLRQQKRPAIVLLIIGIALIVIPYSTIYLFLD